MEQFSNITLKADEIMVIYPMVMNRLSGAGT